MKVFDAVLPYALNKTGQRGVLSHLWVLNDTHVPRGAHRNRPLLHLRVRHVCPSNGGQKHHGETNVKYRTDTHAYKVVRVIVCLVLLNITMFVFSTPRNIFIKNKAVSVVILIFKIVLLKCTSVFIYHMCGSLSLTERAEVSALPSSRRETSEHVPSGHDRSWYWPASLLLVHSV